MLQEIFQFNIQEPISSMAISKEYLAIGTLEENIYLYQQPFTHKPLKLSNHLLGVIDLTINQDETQIAVSSLDSTIKVWDIYDRKLISDIQCAIYTNWQLKYYDSQTIITAGEQGIVSQYHIETKEKISIETDNLYFAQSLAILNQIVVVGNENGILHIISKNGKKNFKLFSKPIRAIKFLGTSKLLVGSDDGMIKLFDLDSCTEVCTFRGHKYGVTDIAVMSDSQFVTSSTDRSIRVWDVNRIYNTKQYLCGNDKPYGVNAVGVHKNMIVGAHDCGIVSFYNIE